MDRTAGQRRLPPAATHGAPWRRSHEPAVPPVTNRRASPAPNSNLRIQEHPAHHRMCPRQFGDVESGAVGNAPEPVRTAGAIRRAVRGGLDNPTSAPMEGGEPNEAGREKTVRVHGRAVRLNSGTVKVTAVYGAWVWCTFTPMSQRTCSPGIAISCSVMSVAWCVVQAQAASGDAFWDDRFGVPGVPYEEGVVSALMAVGSDLYAGGVFTSIGGLSTTCIALWDGQAWHALDSGVDGPVRALEMVDGRVVIGGVFSQAGQLPVKNIAAWDGVAWKDVGGGVNGVVSALASDGTNLYAGGHFTEAGGVAASKVAKWDGVQWSGLGAGIIPVYEPNDWVGAVDSLAVSGHNLYVGGRFRNAGGIGATNIARWDGTNWHALGHGLRYFDGPGSENGTVRTLAALDGTLFAGGSFWRAGDVAATNVARWDGNLWSAMGGADKVVGGLLPHGTGLFAGGSFRFIGGVEADNIARWDGVRWWPLGSGIGGGATGGAMSCSGSELFVGGSFTLAGGKPSTNLALWHIPHSLGIRAEADAVRLSWPSTGTNFALETKDPLQATAWSEVGDTPAALNSELVVTQAVSRASQVYRLRRR